MLALTLSFYKFIVVVLVIEVGETIKGLPGFGN